MLIELVEHQRRAAVMGLEVPQALVNHVLNNHQTIRIGNFPTGLEVFGLVGFGFESFAGLQQADFQLTDDIPLFGQLGFIRCQQGLTFSIKAFTGIVGPATMLLFVPRIPNQEGNWQNEHSDDAQDHIVIELHGIAPLWKKLHCYDCKH